MAQKHRINWALLAKDMRDSREAMGIGIRAYAKEIGLSSSTASRIENEKVCSADEFVHVSIWLRFSPNRYVLKPTQPRPEAE